MAYMRVCGKTQECNYFFSARSSEVEPLLGSVKVREVFEVVQ